MDRTPKKNGQGLNRHFTKKININIQITNKHKKRLKLTNNEGTVKKINQRKMRKNLTHMAGNTF